MKALSVRQPWASLLVRGVKRFELRSWSTNYRGPLVIHASSKAPSADLIDYFDGNEYAATACFDQGWFTAKHLKALPRSAFVGSVIVKDVLSANDAAAHMTGFDIGLCGDLEEGTFVWLLEGARAITPVEGVNGKLNVWEMSQSQAATFDAATELPSLPGSSWTFDTQTDDSFLGLMHRTVTGPAQRIPGLQKPLGPTAFWRAFHAWLDSMGDPSAPTSRFQPDAVAKELTGKKAPIRDEVIDAFREIVEGEWSEELLATVRSAQGAARPVGNSGR